MTLCQAWAFRRQGRALWLLAMGFGLVRFCGGMCSACRIMLSFAL